MIHVIAEGVSQSLNSQNWKPIKVNRTVKAYSTTVSVSEGEIEVIHTNTSALLTAIIYGFANATSYGHPMGYHKLEKFTGIITSSIV